MKKTIIILICIAFLLGCDLWKKPDYFEIKSQYEKYVEKEVLTGKRIENVFLTFEFGDTPQETNQKIQNLTKSGAINKVDDQYKYIFNLSQNTYDFALSVEYNDGKLYKLTLESDTLLGLKYPEDSLFSFWFQGFRFLFQEKYGLPDYVNKSIHSNDDLLEEFAWIDGNKEIFITTTIDNKVYIIYTDKAIELKIEADREAEQKRIKQETLKDI